MFKRTLLFSLVFNSLFVSAQTPTILGRVIDAKTHRALPFVNLVIENTLSGVSSDIDGKFIVSYKSLPAVVKVTYVGYKPLQVDVSKSGQLLLEMEPLSYALKEVEIKAGENPAHRIIKRVLENKALNDPEQLKTFSYNSYTKLLGPIDVEVGDTSKFKGGQHKHLDKHYDIMMETSATRMFKEGKSKEKVLSTRVSGLKEASFGIMATQFQSFSFYKDVIEVAGKKYVSPISSGALGKYFYMIEDTTYNGQDSVFIISYRPYKNKRFEGLKGLLYINTNGYAIQSVTASPSDEIPKIGIKIEQLYERVDQQHWFPVQLNTALVLASAVYKDGKKAREDKLTISGKSYLSNIVINKEIADNEFDDVAVSYDVDATNKTETYWEQVRKDTLDKREKQTYVVVDSIGKKYKLDAKVKAVEALIDGRFPLGYIDLQLNRLLNYNDYEGFRLGLGLVTNDKVSKRFSIAAYSAYGFKDKAFKYGVDGSLFIYKPKQVRLLVGYAKDVIETAGTSFYFNESLTSTESYRDYLVQRMDRLELKSAAFAFRFLQKADVRIGVSQYNKWITNDYRFVYVDNTGSKEIQYFRFSEINIATRIAVGENFAQMPRRRVSLGTKYPVLWVQLNKGLKDVARGMFDYTRLDAKLEKSFYTIGLGKTSVQLVGGHVSGDVPYSNLYNGRGSNKHFTIVAENSFQTAGMNEFIMSEYAAIHVSHNFGRLLYRGKHFKPELLWINNAGWGRLNNSASHKNIAIKTMEKGLFETGFVVNKIFTQQILGYGVGVFYRYGAYRNNDINKDLSVQLSLSLNL